MYDENIAFHEKLLKNQRMRQSGSWLKFRGNSNGASYAGKLHVFAASYPDWHNIARLIIPYLLNNNITFKTINLNNQGLSVVQDKTDHQFGKAFTIYPVDDNEMTRVAHDIDAILQNANLITHGKILYDRAFGKSGRIFYRFERNPFRLDAREEPEYISAQEAQSMAPTHPYNPLNLRDPLLQGIDRLRHRQQNTFEHVINQSHQKSDK